MIRDDTAALRLRLTASRDEALRRLAKAMSGPQPCSQAPGGGRSKICRRMGANRRGGPCSLNGGFAMKNFAPEPPETLSAEACSIWSSIRDEYDISDKAGIVILSAAAEAFD